MPAINGTKKSVDNNMKIFSASLWVRKALGNMHTMTRTNDGFEIAEVDMRLRGPGDIMGTKQSGTIELNMADLIEDQDILQLAREKAIAVLEKDPELKLPENTNLSNYIKGKIRKKLAWSRIS